MAVGLEWESDSLPDFGSRVRLSETAMRHLGWSVYRGCHKRELPSVSHRSPPRRCTQVTTCRDFHLERLSRTHRHPRRNPPLSFPRVWLCAAGTEVIVRTRRGLELGSVLAQVGGHVDLAEGGLILRKASVEDLLLWARAREESNGRLGGVSTAAPRTVGRCRLNGRGVAVRSGSRFFSTSWAR